MPAQAGIPLLLAADCAVGISLQTRKLQAIAGMMELWDWANPKQEDAKMRFADFMGTFPETSMAANHGGSKALL